MITYFRRITAKGAFVNVVNSGVSRLNVTKIVHHVEKFIVMNLSGKTPIFRL